MSGLEVLWLARDAQIQDRSSHLSDLYALRAGEISALLQAVLGAALGVALTIVFGYASSDSDVDLKSGALWTGVFLLIASAAAVVASYQRLTHVRIQLSAALEVLQLLESRYRHGVQ
jgi:hypothetical protein